MILLRSSAHDGATIQPFTCGSSSYAVGTEQHLYLIHCPQHSDWWVMFSAIEKDKFRVFPNTACCIGPHQTRYASRIADTIIGGRAGIPLKPRSHEPI